MLAVMLRLVDLEKQFGLATDEERRSLRLATTLALSALTINQRDLSVKQLSGNHFRCQWRARDLRDSGVPLFHRTHHHAAI